MTQQKPDDLNDAIREMCVQYDEEILLADGYDEAFVGVVTRCGGPTIACYDAKRCVELLEERDGMTSEDADEYFAFNTEGAFVGPHTPCFLRSFKDFKE